MSINVRYTPVRNSADLSVRSKSTADGDGVFRGEFRPDPFVGDAQLARSPWRCK